MLSMGDVVVIPAEKLAVGDGANHIGVVLKVERLAEFGMRVKRRLPHVLQIEIERLLLDNVVRKQVAIARDEVVDVEAGPDGRSSCGIRLRPFSWERRPLTRIG